jgi:hypothetical protein
MTRVDGTGGEAIAAARAAFARCQFDEGACSFGREPEVWKDRPRHDEASHGADAFLTFACSNYSPPSALPTRRRDMRWVV